MKIYIFCNLKLKIGLNKILDKNFLKNNLIKLIYKFLKLVSKLVVKCISPKLTIK